MRRMMGAVLACLLLVIGAAQAQTTTGSPDRAAVLAVIGDAEPYNQTVQAILYLLNDGQINAIDLNSVVFQPGGAVPAYVYDGAIDPAYSRLALLVQTGESHNQPRIDLLDLTTGAIGGVQPPGLGIVNYSGLVFSPDGSQLAAAFVADTTGNFDIVGGIAIWDAVSGAALTVKEYAGLVGDAEQAQFGWPYLGTWTADGIEWHENCYACEGVFAGEWSLWNPATDTVMLTTGRYFNDFFGEVLAGTGEMVVSEFNTAFPNSGIFGQLPPNNTIAYYPAGASVPSPFVETAPFNPIYFDFSAIEFGTPIWGMDGNAVVVGDIIGQTHVLERSGTRAVLPSPGSMSSRPLFGTRTGWAAEETGPMGRGISLIQWSSGTVSGAQPFISDLPFSTRFIVVDTPELGSSQLLTQPFASPIAPPAPEAVPTLMVGAGRSCPGQPVSRLTPGGIGFVLPGVPNRLRELPSTDAAILGEIPGDSMFNVISGPICDGGLVWWQVDYNGAIGYTVEIIDGAYVVDLFRF